MKVVIVLNLFLFLALLKVPSYVQNYVQNLNLEAAKSTAISAKVAIASKTKKSALTSKKTTPKKIKTKRNNTIVVRYYDFTPVKKVELKSVKPKKRESISYAKVSKAQKQIKLKKEIVKRKQIQAKRQLEMKSLVANKLDLSLAEISDQGAVEVNKLEKIAWTNFSLKEIKQNEKTAIKTVVAVNIDEEKKSDRISTLAAATAKVANETSTEINRKENTLARTSMKKISNEPVDELVFFDYANMSDEAILKEQNVETDEASAQVVIIEPDKAQPQVVPNEPEEVEATHNEPKEIKAEVVHNETEKAKAVDTHSKPQEVKVEVVYSEPEEVEAEIIHNEPEKVEVTRKKPEQKTTVTTSLLDIQKEVVDKVTAAAAAPTKTKASNTNKSNANDYAKIIEQMKKEKEAFPKIAQADGQTPNPQPASQEKNNFLAASATDDQEEMAAESVDYSCMNEKQHRKSYMSEYTISATSIGAGKTFEKLHSFEIRFQDNIDDIKQDYGSGEIKFKLKTIGQMNVRRGVLLASKHYPLATDFIYEGLATKMDIPVFTREAFDNLIRTNNLYGLGAHFLIELDDQTEDVELDVNAKYEDKLYLNEKLVAVNRNDSDYKYILFVGLDAGNTVVYYKNAKNEVTHKIVHLVEKEIYYDPNFYAEFAEDSIELYEENLLSKCKGLLDVASTNITPWSFKGQTQKESVNKHKIGRMIYPLGTRKYYELSHLNESIFIGRWEESKLVVPDEEYIDFVLKSFNAQPNECLVQLNLAKNIARVEYNGLSKGGMIQPVVQYLDDDGKFYSEVSDKTKKVFIRGEEQGLLNIQLEYLDGSSQFIQTFCSQSTYLIEQL